MRLCGLCSTKKYRPNSAGIFLENLWTTGLFLQALAHELLALGAFLASGFLVAGFHLFLLGGLGRCFDLTSCAFFFALLHEGGLGGDG